MQIFKDICRICLQEVDYQDAEEINVARLHNLLTSKPFLSFLFFQKWQVEFFQDHLICNTCIQNFHTIREIYRCAYRSNNAISVERNKRHLRKVNLKRLDRFGQIEGDFIVCRICLKLTRQIAIYLYDNINNILPVEYIEKMVKHIRIYTNFDSTINPILCHPCWQNIQISFSFSKHLELVTGKVSYYQIFFNKMNVNREDLVDILARWDKLGTVRIKTEIGIEFKKESDPELESFKSVVTNLEGKTRMKKSVATVETGYSLYDDHSYVRLAPDKTDISRSKAKVNNWSSKRKSKITNQIEESNPEMPVLTPNVEKECLEEMPLLIPSIETYIENKKIFQRNVLTKIVKGKYKEKQLRLGFDNRQQKHDIESTIDQNINRDNTRGTEQLRNTTKYQKVTMHKEPVKPKDIINYKDKLRCAKKHDEAAAVKKVKNRKSASTTVKKGKVSHRLKNKPNEKSNAKESSEYLKLLILEDLRPRTRLSTKKEITNDPLSQDLLVLRKEEIVKDKRQKRKINASFPDYTSSSKIGNKNSYKPNDPLSQDLLVLRKEEIVKDKRQKRKINASFPDYYSSSSKIANKNADKSNVSIPSVESSPSKSNTEYTFETLNLDNEVQVKKEIIEEEELQIKREILSECESDDEFNENTRCNTNDTQSFDDECPNLESFIKSEPPDESFLMDLDEEGPPELEFQGPCVPGPIPCFTIQNTFSVDEKRHLINTVDEKKNLMNVVEQKTPFVRSTVEFVKSAVNVTQDKRCIETPPVVKRLFSLTPPNNLSKASSEKPKQKRQFFQVKMDLFNSTIVHKTQEKITSPKFDRNLDINLTKPDEKATLTFKKNKELENKSVSNNAGAVTQASTSSIYQDHSDYCSMGKFEITPKKPYFCPLCDFSTTSERAAQSHSSQHISNSLHLYYCKICGFASTRKAGLAQHNKRVHAWEHNVDPLAIRKRPPNSSNSSRSQGATK